MVKDLHCHLLWGIDDGSKSIEESIGLLKKISASGCKEIILTPHYIRGSKYKSNNKEKKKLFNELKEEAKKENIDVKMYLGNEVFFTSKFVELIDEEEIEPLNNSRYLLFEFPMSNTYHNAGEILSHLISKGYIPILAHPERYQIFQKNPDLIEEYLRMGILLQGNYTSLLGKYGGKSKKTLKYLIKKGWVSFLGSDTHRDFHYKMNKVEKIVNKLNKDPIYVHDLLEGNFDKVINNQDIAMIR